MTATTLLAVAVLCALAAYALRVFGWQGVPLLSVLSVLLLMSHELAALSQIVPTLLTLDESIASHIRTALRIVGVGYLTGITSDVCRDLGEVGIGRAACMVGRVEILVLALPFFKTIVDMGVSLLK